MRRAASAAGDNSKITGLHADVLRARCGAFCGTACIQVVTCPAPRSLDIVRDREIMPVRVQISERIGDVLQCEITIQHQRGTGQLILGLTGRADGARYGRHSADRGQFHVIVEFDRAAVCRVHRGNSVSPALIVLPVHGKGVFLDTLEERQVLANDTGPFAVLFRRRADVQLVACHIVDGNLERAGVLGAGFVGSETVEPVRVLLLSTVIVDFSAVGRAVERYRHFIAVVVGGFLRRYGERRLGSRQRLIQCRLHG